MPIRRAQAVILTALITVHLFDLLKPIADAQLQGGNYDFGQGRYGEKRGDFTPSEWLSIILIVMTIAAGFALTIALCYWVSKRQADDQGSQLSSERRDLKKRQQLI